MQDASALERTGANRLPALAMAGLLAAALVVPWARVLAQTGDPVLLNELLVSHTGADTTEFFELYGTPGHPLAGLSVVVVDGDGSRAGTIDLRIDLPADAHLGGNGFYLVGNPVGLAANYGVAPDLALPAPDLVPNGSQTVALVATAGLAAAGATVTGGEDVRDAVGLTDAGPSDAWFWSAPVLGPDDGFMPAGGHRTSDGVDTDSAVDWAFADDLLGPVNTPTAATPYVAATPTPTPIPTPTPTPEGEPVGPAAMPDVSALVEMLASAVDAGAVAETKVHQLTDRLDRVQRFLDSGQTAAAAAQLRAFANQVRGFAPRWLDSATADALAAAAVDLRASLGG